MDKAPFFIGEIMAKDNKKIIEKALEDYKLCVDLSKDIEEAAAEDLEFYLGEQWDAQAQKDRKEDGRPCLVVNKLPAFVSQVTNEQRQNRPQIKARPVDSDTDPKTAEVVNGIIRHIQSYSNADQAYDTAFEYAVTCGFGFFRVLTDYCNDESFDQEILIKRIEDPMSVRFPFHLCKEADYSDVPFVFIEENIPRKLFEEMYPKVDISEWQTSERSRSWITEDSVRVAEYWRVEETETRLYSITDEQGNEVVVEELPEGFTASKERTVKKKTVKWSLLTAADILDEGEFSSKYIPIIPVVGREIVVEGKKHFISLVRHAKDPQRMLNYWKSAETEAIALAPKSPYIAAAGQLEGFEGIWAEANRKNISVLPYNATDKSGNLLPAPQRAASVAVPTAIVNAIAEANDDIKSTTGIFDASLGKEGNETSGRAIIARQREGDTANYHFLDNMGRAIRHAGRIIVDLIPKIYDTARVVRILGEDMKEKIVTVNQLYRDEGGEDLFYDLSVGKYDVVVDIGPSYTTRRMEAAENLLNFIQSVPTAGQVAGDLIAKMLDFPGSDIFAERLQKMVPPEMLADSEKKEQQAPGVPEEEVAQIVADLQKMQMELQQAVEAVQMLQQENGQLKQQADKQAFDSEQKEQDRQVKIAEATIKSETEIKKEEIKTAPSIDELLGLFQKLSSRLDNLETSNRPESARNAE